MAKIVKTGKKSVVMLFGLTAPDDTIAVNPFEIFQKEIVLKASFIHFPRGCRSKNSNRTCPCCCF